MALTDFFNGIRTVAKSAPLRKAPVRPRNLTNGEHRSPTGDPWLTPKLVNGFDVEDFTFLSKDQRSELARNVDRIRQLAATVPNDHPATSQQVAEASEPLREIYEMVHPFLDRKYLEVRSAIEQLFADGEFPEFVRRFDLRVGNDHSGDPAAWVWLIVDDSADEDAVFKAMLQAELTISFHLSELGIERFVYGGVRTVSEQKNRLEGIY